jgi:hypothetical protein
MLLSFHNLGNLGMGHTKWLDYVGTTFESFLYYRFFYPDQIEEMIWLKLKYEFHHIFRP